MLARTHTTAYVFIRKLLISFLSHQIEFKIVQNTHRKSVMIMIECECCYFSGRDFSSNSALTFEAQFRCSHTPCRIFTSKYLFITHSPLIYWQFQFCNWKSCKTVKLLILLYCNVICIYSINAWVVAKVHTTINQFCKIRTFNFGMKTHHTHIRMFVIYNIPISLLYSQHNLIDSGNV